MRIVRILSVAAVLAAFAYGANAADKVPESEWGAEDERGAVNRITPQKILEASKLIEKGQVYELGRVYEDGMPLFPGRHYSLSFTA